LISLGEKGLAYIGSSLLVLRELAIRSGTVITYFSTSHNYRVAWETLQRAVQRTASGIPVTYIGLAALAMLVVTIVIVRTARNAWRKGETHVGII
jgi:hypothetical protein